MVPFSAHTIRDAVDIHAMLSRTTLISAIPLVSYRGWISGAFVSAEAIKIPGNKWADNRLGDNERRPLSLLGSVHGKLSNNAARRLAGWNAPTGFWLRPPSHRPIAVRA